MNGRTILLIKCQKTKSAVALRTCFKHRKPASQGKTRPELKKKRKRSTLDRLAHSHTLSIGMNALRRAGYVVQFACLIHLFHQNVGELTYVGS
jgi:hypothetical protein